MSSLKIDKIDMSISWIQVSKSQKRDFRHFSGANVCYSNGNVKFKNFMQTKWREEKFLRVLWVTKQGYAFETSTKR